MLYLTTTNPTINNINNILSGQHFFRLALGVFITICCIMFFSSCDEKPMNSIKEQEVESQIQAAYKVHDYARIITLADLQEQDGKLSELKACYWRGYANSRLRKMRLAESEWKRAITVGVRKKSDLEYYAKSVNRLCGLLYMKSDYEGTIRVAVPALKLLQKEEYTMNTDYANVHTFVGNCQLKLGNTSEAAENYQLAYRYYMQIMEADNRLSNYTASIIGIITIVDAYLQTAHYEDAYHWTGQLDNMLQRYKQHPQANTQFIDKQWARLNFYRSCILEKMGQHSDAQETFHLAQQTDYAKTSDGQIEATSYLIASHQWVQAATNFEVLEEQLRRYDMKMTLDNIHTYLLPKYRANVGAHRLDSAIKVGTWICNALDTAMIWERQNAAMELATIYDLQQKETEIAEQRARMSQQRMLALSIVFVLVIIGFGLFIYFRHQAAKRLETAYHHLEIANTRAEESSRIKSDFIQQISHEIRTPLNVLSGFTQILTTPGMKLDKSMQEDINRQINENTTRIINLVNKMLELSDAKNQTVIEQNDELPVIQIAAEAIDASGITTASHLTFDLKVSPGLEKIMFKTNREAAVRALSLILDNARKFTAPAEARQHGKIQEAGKSVVLRLTNVSGHIYFAVEDTGIGVPREEAERIFEEFVQLDEYYDGTGIGLTVARSLARRLGGDIVLDTVYTDGARFVMTLPLS